MSLSPQFGAEAKGARRQTIQQSPNYYDGEFRNPVETNMDLGFNGTVKAITSRLFGRNDSLTPDHMLPAIKLDSAKIAATRDTATVITWLGHSAFIVEIDGKRLLLDPMLGNRASPFSFMGPKRFSELPISLEQMPHIDAVLISHDHYDHLDYGSIKELTAKTTHFYVALGVGAHLERWGVPADKITELDWWQEATFQGLTFAATPARHFSGRGFSDRMQTLWTSWVILGSKDKVFFSGDSGYFDGFKEIGQKYGPFDITLMECGQYNELWPNIHMMPAQTVQAHQDLKGKLLMPIHWGTFALALHPWTDPIERVTAEARELGVPIATPRIGERVILHKKVPRQDWWLE
ncbi:MBL fold metallo-hydrolase [Pontibacter aydingkolensis]